MYIIKYIHRTATIDTIKGCCYLLVVLNMLDILFLISTSKITKSFYPDSVTDDFDANVTDIIKTNLKNKVKFGKNVLIGENVKIGKNCLIGHNTILESNVVIGDNCSVGSNVILRNTIVKNNVNILDGCIVGKKENVVAIYTLSTTFGVHGID